MTGRFRRKMGVRRYKRMFVIVAEGTVTEQEYFDLLNDESIVRVRCLRNPRNLTPRDALERIRNFLRAENLRKTDEAWIVVDRDSWQEEHLLQLHAWSLTHKSYGFALSNPKFELWLLLHFEDGKGVANGRDCDSRLSKHLPKYNKHLDARIFTRERVGSAIERARLRDNPPCVEWPRGVGSTVYKLVERVLANDI